MADNNSKINISRVLAYAENYEDGGNYPIVIDPISRALSSIEVDHYHIHEELSFTAYYTVTTAATNSHRSGLYMKTPPDSENPTLCHAVISFASSAAASFSICEAPTIAANVGTHTSVIYNRYRDSQKVSKCYNNATIPVVGYYTTLTEAQIAGDGTWATGTIIRTEPLRVGVGPNPAGGSSRGTQEYILKPNTKYVFLLTNTTADANTHYILVDWYEHKRLAH